jgi:hypothetical protein
MNAMLQQFHVKVDQQSSVLNIMTSLGMPTKREENSLTHLISLLLSDLTGSVVIYGKRKPQIWGFLRVPRPDDEEAL